MRSLMTDVAPNVVAPMLDWFHLAMKLQAVRTALFARSYACARKQRRRISTAPAESVMNHLINRRMSKRQHVGSGR
jgi:hypothetical protein